MFKPFRPPQPKAAVQRVEKKPIDLTVSDSEDEGQQRPYKRRKLLEHVPESPVKKVVVISAASSAPRKPLLVVKNCLDANKGAEPSASEAAEGYYIVLWRKFTTKKNKTWDGDGVLAVYGGYARLQDISGREMGKCMYKDPLLPGSMLSVGGKDVGVDSVLSKAEFLAGKPFLKGGVQSTDNMPTAVPGKPKQKITLNGSKGQPLLGKKNGREEEEEDEEIPAKSFYGSHKSDAMKSQYKSPLLPGTDVPDAVQSGKSRHRTDAEGALIMKRPRERDCPKGKKIVDVVVDPFIGKWLRDHQRDGVKFLYECVMGMRDFHGQGALLADEMGLGKTLQTIALIWTLLKQTPFHGSEPKPSGVIKKALIVCPVTLMANWKKEFVKWLGPERLGVLIADGKDKTKLRDFTHGHTYNVAIVGYEKLRTLQDELKQARYPVDLVIADEGHRLKTAKNKSAEAIRALNTDRRVILSGTPLQNDLSEFFVMVDFINPGLLGTFKTFKKEFEAPILKSRQPGASKKDIEKGNAREEELSSTTKQFILRRTAEIQSKYLLPKCEYVLFCKPTQAQAQVYQHVLESPALGRILGGNTECAFQLITLLKKVCNAPSLLAKKDEAAASNANIAQLLEVIPAELLQRKPANASSKFRVMNRLLQLLSTKTDEKIVIVSNWTSTLDIIGYHLTTMGLPFLRLDGSTPSAVRQDLVDKFNKTPASKNFAFLLSAKSGGTGINLIGASRLILFDVDWNPATDLQAMARIHRDGQKRPVKIYRFLMAGGMDEKIYQRQVSKMGLADSVVDGKKNEASFSAAELRDLFRLDLKALCQTHDLLGCDCKGLGVHPVIAPDPEEPIEIIESEEENSEDEFPALNMVTATKANIAALDKKIANDKEEEKKQKKASKMQALMRYAHLNTSIFDEEAVDAFGFEKSEIANAKEVLDDEILFEVLKDQRCKVDYVFAKNG